MKTKNKVLAVLEIAIVLCSVFLVPLPAIAADMQEVSTSASEDDFVLGVYGNANEDDTIDMRDLTYVKLIFFGKKHETELADAKYDGKINPLDFIQIKLIIVGKEKELTVVQYLEPWTTGVLTEEPVTVPMPIESIAALYAYGTYTLCALGEQDKIVAVVSGTAKDRGEIRDLIEDKPEIGRVTAWDIEKILELNPDIVLAYACYDYSNYRKTLDAAGIPLVQMDFHKPKVYSKALSNLGWMLDKKERVEELINFEQQHLDLIEERVKGLGEEQKPRVYYISGLCYYGAPTRTSGKSPVQDTIEFCGGINIFADIEGYVTIDPEEVIVRNPQVIYARTDYMCPLGYDITDTGTVEKFRQDIIMDYPGFDHIDAVENGRVYLITPNACTTHPSVQRSYLAKWFHPDLFEDIDPVEIHREWLETFFGIEYQGVYAYPTYPV